MIISVSSVGTEVLPQALIINPYIFSTRCRRPLIFQTRIISRQNSKFERIKPPGLETFQFVAKTLKYLDIENGVSIECLKV